MGSVSATDLAVSQAAPLAHGWSVLVPPVELDVLDGVAKSKLHNTSASRDISMDLDDW